MLRSIIRLFTDSCPHKAKPCSECGDVTLIGNLDNSGICRKCKSFAGLLKESRNLKHTCPNCGRDFASVKDQAGLCFFCKREQNRQSREPRPILDRIRNQNIGS